jgi:sulfate permease, SulP family
VRSVIRRLVPALTWLPRYRRSDLPGDLVAGLTAAAILIPQSMAYATIAGLPPVVGLYASVVPLVVYAMFGRSAQLGVGPLASISIFSAVAVGAVAHHDAARFIALSATMALLVGLLHVFVGAARLGFVLRFLAEPVMTGFLAAIGILIIATQLAPMTGVSVPTTGRVDDIVRHWVDVAGHTSLWSLGLGLVALGLLLLLGRRWPRLPMPLLLVIVAIGGSAALGLQAHGVHVVGPVPSGLAGPRFPPFGSQDLLRLLPAAAAITVVSILESLGVARQYAERHGVELDANQEIAALGLANVAAGCFQGMVVTGAITRSSILEESGARTPLAGVVSAGAVLPILLFAAGSFRDLPLPVLAAIVIVAVLPFVNIAVARRLWHVQRSDFWLLVLAFAGSLALGIELGIALAAAVSVAAIVYRVTRPTVPELGRIPGTDYFLERAHHPDAATYPGTMIVRLNASLYFVNAEAVEQILRHLEARRQLHTVVLDASGVDHLDTTADHMLRKLATEYATDGVELFVVNVADGVRQVMDASGFAALIGDDHFFATDTDAVAQLERRASSTAVPTRPPTG